MTFAVGQRTALRYVAESAFGTPSGTIYKALRQVTNSLNLKKGTIQSKEIRSDRLLSDLRHGGRSVAGDIQHEVGIGVLDDLIEAAVSGTWSAPTTGAITAGATTGTNTVDRTTGSFLTDGFDAGDEITLAGFGTGANNGDTKIVSIAPNGLTMVVEKALTTEADAAGVTISLKGKKVKSGTLQKTFSFERAFLDVAQFALYSGCAIDRLKLSVKPEEIITATLSVVGKDVTLGTVTNSTSITAAATNSPFDSFTGTLEEGGAAIATIASIELTLANNRKGQMAIGQKTPEFLSDGQLVVTGTATMFFVDEVALNKFLNETESSIDVKLLDLNGTDFHRFRIPRVKYTGGDLDNPADGPVKLTLPFTGLADSQSAANFIYQRSNAA